MSITLGRYVGADDPDGGTIRQSGDTLSFDFDLVGTSVADMQAKIQQIRGLNNNPAEKAFPFTWSEDGNLDGYYTDVRADVTDTDVALATGFSRASVSMTRIAGGWKRPRIETLVSRGLRVNAHGVVTPASIAYALQNGATTLVESDLGLWSGLVASSGLYTDTNPVAFGSVVNIGEYSYALGSRAYTTTLPPANYYDSACKIEVAYGGVYYTMEGPQVPVEVASNPWRMSNGNVRVYPTYNTGTRTVDLKVESYDGTTWNGTVFAFGDGASGAWAAKALLGAGSAVVQTSPWYLRVVKNTPWTCVIRIDYVQFTTYLTVLRGHPYVIVKVVENNTAATVKHGWKATAPGGPVSAAFAGGAHATADDTNLRRWQIVTPVASTVAATPAVWTTAATLSSTWQLCPDYKTEVTAAAGVTMRDYFLCATSFAQSVVPR